MTHRGWAIILRKELAELFRDKRVRFGVIISPLILTPAILGLVGRVMGGQRKAQALTTYRVGLVAPQSPALQDAVKGPQLLEWVNVDRTEAEKQIRGRTLRAAAVFPPDTEERLTGSRKVDVALIYDAGNDSSQDAAQRIRQLLNERSKRLVQLRLMEQGLSSDLATPFQAEDRPMASGGTVGTMVMAMLLPYMLSLSAILGSVYAANDLVAGEKERGTLEALLIAPVSRWDVVIGKFSAVAVVALVSSQLSVIGLLAPVMLKLPGMDWLAQGGLKLSGMGVGAMVLIQIPLALMGAGLLLAVSTYSRNQKEAQSYLAPLMTVISVLAMMSLLMKAEADLWLAVVPVLNAALALKQALVNSIDPIFVSLACLMSVVYAGLAAWLATALFSKESVLLKA